MRAPRARPIARFLAAAVAGGCLLGSVPSAHAVGTPPWEPDPNAVAGIAFYDATGQQITTGPTSGAMAAYAVASNDIQAGDNTAVLYGALPNTTEDPSAWSREQLSGGSAFPAAGAPPSIGTNPAVAGSAQDESLATFAAHFPSSSGVYQIRIRTYDSTSGSGLSNAYAAADILISGHTWTEVYPKNATRPVAFTNKSRPRLSGKHKVGTTETCSSGTWTPKPSSFAYQWFKGSKKVKSATRASLRLTKALKGKSIHCTVTAHKYRLKDVAASSKSVKVTA